MSSLPTEILYIIGYFLDNSIILRKVCKRLSKLTYRVYLHLPNTPIVNFSPNLQVVRLHSNPSSRELHQTGIDFSRVISFNCQSNALLQDEDLSLMPYLMTLECGHNPNFTDKGLSYLKNLVQLR